MSAPLDPRLDRPHRLWARLLAGVAGALLRGRRPAALRRVLVVRTDERVGNALLTVPLVRALQRALPGAQIDLLLAAQRAPVARGLAGITVVPFEKTDAFRHPLRYLRWLWALRRAGYDAAIDAAHWHAFSLTSALLSRWATRGTAVGAARGPLALYDAVVPLPPPGTREVEAKVALAAGLGVSPTAAPALETALGLSAEGIRAARALGDAPFAALNPGARKPDHRWPAAQFAALASGLRAQAGLRSVVLWGPGEEALAAEVVAAAGGAATLAPATDLEALAAVLRRAALVVTNDSGPMHLAVACGAAVVALFLAGDGDRWGHGGPRFRAVDARAPDAGRAALGAALALAAGAGSATAP